MRESARVAYTGTDWDGITLGDQGTVISADGSVNHVLWATGARTGQVVPVYDYDLSQIGGRSASAVLEDSLEVGSLTAFAAREVYDDGGEVAVLNQMVDHGHLAAFADIAERAISMVSSEIRQDPSMRAVLAQLDEEEGESVLRLASACLIRDAFGED